MKKILLFVFCVGISNVAFSQTGPKVSLPIEGGNEINIDLKILVLDGSSISMNTIGEFKDELIAWKEKIVSITIDESNHRVTVVHNKLLEQRELFDVIRKYNFPKASIISYN